MPDRTTITAEDRQLLSLLSVGTSLSDTARLMGVSARKLRTRRLHLQDTLGVSADIAAVVEAIRQGLI